jgi:hypothetical protein
MSTRNQIAADIVAEIGRAEAAAQRILKRRWDEVIAVALAIFRRKSGALTGKQVAQTIRLYWQWKAAARKRDTFHGEDRRFSFSASLTNGTGGERHGEPV